MTLPLGRHDITLPGASRAVHAHDTSVHDPSPLADPVTPSRQGLQAADATAPAREPLAPADLDGSTAVARMVVDLQLAWGWNLMLVPRLTVSVLLHNGRGHEGWQTPDSASGSTAADAGSSTGWFDWRECDGLYYRRSSDSEAWQRIPGVGTSGLQQLPELTGAGVGALQLSLWDHGDSDGQGRSSSRQFSFRFLPDGRFHAGGSWASVSDTPGHTYSRYYDLGGESATRTTVDRLDQGAGDLSAVHTRPDANIDSGNRGCFEVDGFVLHLRYDDGRHDRQGIVAVGDGSYLIGGRLFV